MNGTERTLELIEALIGGTLSPDEHAEFQQRLRTNAEERRRFRERIDLEAGLRTWAMDTPLIPPLPVRTARRLATTWAMSIAAVVTVGLSVWITTMMPSRTPPSVGNAQPSVVRSAGDLIERDDAVWSRRPGSGGSLLTGSYTLVHGVAEMRFDSGATVVAEGPCELLVLSADEARLGSGAAYVTVSDVATGFTLRTPESRIIDDRAEFAVSIRDDSTEVHVFDGRVHWIADGNGGDIEETIEAGQARRYPRNRPEGGAHVPLGQRRFARALELQVQESAGEAIIAYDGFEYLAGQLRRGRSGFGWSGGWQSLGRARGPLAEVVDAPPGAVFDNNRTGKRELLMRDGEGFRRTLENPITIGGIGDVCFISFIAQRVSPLAGSDGTSADSSLRLLLDSDAGELRRRARSVAGVGVSKDGFPFASAGARVSTTATRLADVDPVFCVLRVQPFERDLRVSARFYRSGEVVDTTAPNAWTVSASDTRPADAISAIRLIVGEAGAWRVDELRIGQTWESVVAPSK